VLHYKWGFNPLVGQELETKREKNPYSRVGPPTGENPSSEVMSLVWRLCFRWRKTSRGTNARWPTMEGWCSQKNV